MEHRKLNKPHNKNETMSKSEDSHLEDFSDEASDDKAYDELEAFKKKLNNLEEL